MEYIKFYRYFLPFWKKEALVLFLNSINMGIGLLGPYMAKLMIDKAYGKKDLKLFIILVAVGGFMFILSSVINGVSGYLNMQIKFRISFDFNRKVFRKLQELPYSFFQDSSTGEHIYRISYDVQQFVQFITGALPRVITLIPRSILVVVIALFLNWKMTSVVLVLTPFLYLITVYFTKKRKKVLETWVKNSQVIFNRLQEVMTHMQLVKAFGKERRELRYYIKSLIKNLRVNFENIRLEIKGSFASSLTNRIILGSIGIYGGYQLIKGNLSLGSLTAIMMYLNQLSGLQVSLANFFQQGSLVMVSYNRLETILAAQPEVAECQQAEEIIFPENSIEFRNLTFTYKVPSTAIPPLERETKAVLSNLNFSIASGACVGLVGSSGCGKTTIINLLLRLYQPQSGEILVGGRNINTIKSQAFYSQIGVVLQEPFLFDDSLENNIRYGQEDADLRAIEEAAAVACIDDFINSLPQGYATRIGENACKISEGQKQRLSIARAVVKKPKILILDEALSSVDVEIEERILANIRKALKGSTIIIISHRLSTINKLDLIYFLQGPQKIDIAEHRSLLAQNRSYQDYLACR
ncbi:ABC transporter ATP-binding protein [bacterium]|nr:MAG: ABC transporter ATP-binding protein [bacterium]